MTFAFVLMLKNGRSSKYANLVDMFHNDLKFESSNKCNLIHIYFSMYIYRSIIEAMFDSGRDFVAFYFGKLMLGKVFVFHVETINYFTLRIKNVHCSQMK